MPYPMLLLPTFVLLHVQLVHRHGTITISRYSMVSHQSCIEVVHLDLREDIAYWQTGQGQFGLAQRELLVHLMINKNQLILL